MERVVASGHWLYDGAVPTIVRVVRLDYDFWYALGEQDGDLGPDDRPRLNDEGFLYYVVFRPTWTEGQPFWPDSVGSATVDEAKAAAEARLPSAVTWR